MIPSFVLGFFVATLIALIIGWCYSAKKEAKHLAEMEVVIGDMTKGLELLNDIQRAYEERIVTALKQRGVDPQDWKDVLDSAFVRY